MAAAGVPGDGEEAAAPLGDAPEEPEAVGAVREGAAEIVAAPEAV